MSEVHYHEFKQYCSDCEARGETPDLSYEEWLSQTHGIDLRKPSGESDAETPERHDEPAPEQEPFEINEAENRTAEASVPETAVDDPAPKTVTAEQIMSAENTRRIPEHPVSPLRPLSAYNGSGFDSAFESLRRLYREQAILIAVYDAAKSALDAKEWEISKAQDALKTIEAVDAKPIIENILSSHVNFRS